MNENEVFVFEKRKNSQLRDVLRRLFKNKGAIVGLCILIIFVLMCVFADVISPYDYAEQDLTNAFCMPNAEHPFGTDNYGRDTFTRVLYGGRISLLISVIAVSFSVVIGPIIGAIAGYFGGRTDNVIMRILDIFMAIPGMLLAITVSVALGTGTVNTAIAISIGTIPNMARIIRAQVLTVRTAEFVEAARAAGANEIWIIAKHIIPNSLAPLIVQASLSIGSAVLMISSLSFLGCGIQPPTPEWGSMLSAGRAYIRTYWPMVIFPGLAIMLTMLSFNLLGDGLRDAMDPKLKR